MPIIKLRKDNVTLSSSNTTTVTFTDENIKSNSKLELMCDTDNIYYTNITISNGTCSYEFPSQESNKTVSFRLYINANYYNSTSKSLAGTATVAQVRSGKTFSSASGIGLTGTYAGGFSSFYKYIGETVTCNLSGSHTVSNYSCDVVYTGPVTYGDPTSGYQMCLLGNNYVAAAAWTTAYNYIWTATFAAGQVSDTSKTITNVKMPTKDQIVQYCNGREYRSDRFSNGYWTSTSNGSSYAWFVNGAGLVADNSQSLKYGVVPYIIIPL